MKEKQKKKDHLSVTALSQTHILQSNEPERLRLREREAETEREREKSVTVLAVCFCSVFPQLRHSTKSTLSESLVTDQHQ